MTAENADENSGFKAGEDLNCISGTTKPAKGCRIFPHLCHETTTI